jgi:hypothetical protein
MFRRLLAGLDRALGLARLFDLPDRHPDPMVAASIVLYVGVGIIIAITVWRHCWRNRGFSGRTDPPRGDYTQSDYGR